MITAQNKFRLALIAQILILASLIVASLLVALPTINRHVQDPNLIAYFNHDEGYIMDLVWYYYSGKKSVSFQYDRDYGLEFRYLSDIGRLILAKFFAPTQGTFVIILRWLNLLAWVASLIALWLLIRNHFGGLWQETAVVLLLGTSPSFAYFSNNIKPEPLVLLLMLIGLYYTLKIAENPRLIFVFLAIFFATLAFLVKYAGAFLLPAIVIAMCLAFRDNTEKKPAFPVLKFAWILPAICGVFLIMLPFAIIFWYRRRTGGITWYEQYGLWQSFANNKMLIYLVVLGMLLVIISFVFRLLNSSSPGTRIRLLADAVNKINSNGLIVTGIFIICCFVVGFRWVLHPSDFIDLCAQTGREAFGYGSEAASSGGFTIFSFFKNLAAKIREMNIVIFALFIIYLIVEVHRRLHSLAYDRKLFFKRLTLAAFTFPFFIYMSTGGRVTQHHMLPFFAVVMILDMEGIRLLLGLIRNRPPIKIFIILISAILIIYAAAQNAMTAARSFIYMYHKNDDVVFDIVKWWRSHYDRNVRILADHPTRVYLPAEYKNVKFLKSINEDDKIYEMRELVKSFRPQLIYYNSRTDAQATVLPIEEILPGQKVRLVALFDNGSRYYKRWPISKFLIYELSYEDITFKSD